MDKLVLHFNNPVDDPEANLFNLPLEMSKNDTIGDLKIRIGEMLNIPSNEFIIKRNPVARELKNLKDKLLSAGVGTGSLIKVEIGTPHDEDLFELKIYEVALLKQSDDDSILFDKKFIKSISIKPSITCAQLKTTLKEGIEGEFRLRNPKVDDLGEIIHDDDVMESLHLFDGKEILL